MIEPPRETMPVTRLRGQRDVAQQHAGVHGEVVHALLGLLDQRVAVDLPGQVLGPRRRPSRAPGRSARCRSAPASCGGSTRASRGCSCRWRGPSPCRRPRASPSAASRPPPRSTSVTAELPMLALIFTRKLRPMIIGSSSRWLMLAGMIARPRATSARTNSAGSPSRTATNSISGRDLAAARVVELRADAGLAAPRRDPRLAQLRQARRARRGPADRWCRRAAPAARRRRAPPRASARGAGHAPSGGRRPLSRRRPCGSRGMPSA